VHGRGPRRRRLARAVASTFLAACLACLFFATPRVPAAVFAPDVVSRFAPTVVLAGGENYLPASVPWFLNRSTLEWHNDDGCGYDLIRPARRWSVAEMSALGTGQYATKSRDASCRKAGPRYTTRDHTRPTDGGRPGGLAASDGFVLNLQGNGDAVRGGIKDTTPEDPGRYTGAPVYYESGDLAKPGVPVGTYMYLTYWFFYAYDNGPGPQNHEGDWEGMSVIFGQVTPGHYRPVALGLNQHRGTEEVRWDKRRFPGERPLVYSAKGTHATYDHDWFDHIGPNADTVGGGPLWDASASALPLASQPWAGYCGGWGQVGEEAELLGRGDTTGPLGAGCAVNGRIIKAAIPKGWGTPAPLGQGPLGIAVVDP
jgi:hypothetical protein